MNESTISVFVGVSLPPAFLMGAVQEQVRQAVNQRVPGIFTKEPRPHITLAYIGSVDKALVAANGALDQLLSQAARLVQEPLCVQVTHHAKILGSDAIVLLVNEHSGGLQKIAHFLHERLPSTLHKPAITFLPFVAHVTLGRVTPTFVHEQSEWLHRTLLPSVNSPYIDKTVTSCIDRIVLFRSHERGEIVTYQLGTGLRV